jgi:hypothetical protein
MSRALRTMKKIEKAILRGHIVYDEYESGYVRIRFVSNRLQRTMFDVTVDNPGVKPDREGLAIINCDYGCRFGTGDLCDYLRNRENLTNTGHAFEMESRNSPPIKLPYWILNVPAYKRK